MKILYIKLVNFIGIHAARGLKDVEYDFSKIDKPIIQLYGPNRCGKTVLIQQLHPFSSINLSGDDRSDLSLILPGETGIKNIVYEFNGDTYDICHTYRPNSSGTNHTVSSSLKKNGEELNSSGGVNLFNTLINNIFGFNKYTFQFVINGTQLASFASMSVVQRKNLLNKAMGIDIYDRIHKLSTDDYRYTNKLITSLNNTKEYILSTYGSYENLQLFLNKKQTSHDTLDTQLKDVKSRMDVLSGQIHTLKSQNISYELSECERMISLFENAQSKLGTITDDTYDILVNEQIKLNSEISENKNKRSLLMQEIDNLYSKKEDIENTIKNNKRLKDDYENMIKMKNDITNQINSLCIEIPVSSSSAYFSSMISVAKLINSMCQEISTTLNSNHLELLCKMVCQDIDVAAFIVQEGSLILDSEKEKTVISKIQSLINTVDGEFYDKCEQRESCVYWKTYDTLKKYFKASQNTSNARFSQYDMEQFDHAFKNVTGIRKLINQSTLTEELQALFDLKHIMMNIQHGDHGIDIQTIQTLMESAVSLETRNRLISQLNDIDKRLELMKDIVISSDDVSSTLQELSDKISMKNKEMESIQFNINNLTNALSDNDSKRMILSQIKHIKLNDIKSKQQKYSSMLITLKNSEDELNTLSSQYTDMNAEFTSVKNELKILSDAFNQYNKTVEEIDKFSTDDNMYRIIAEATSSTKGKPVLAIREEIERALIMTNRLLDVMYDGEIEMLSPTIDESHFSLPFRSGSNTSFDIKYGSQSESCLLSLALSLSMASSLTHDMVPLVDEVDAYVDTHMKDSFISMLQEIMTTLNIEQLFLISHNMAPGQYDHTVHILDITEND